MSAEVVMLIILAFLFVFGGLIRKLAERFSEQVDVEEGARADQEASPGEIREFLRSLEVARKPRVQHDVRPLREGPDEVLAVAEAVEVAPAEERAVMPRPWSPAPQRQEPVRRPPREMPSARQPRRAAPRETREAPPSPAKPAERRRAVEVPPEAVKAAAVTPLALRGFGLKRAVVWSEILGRPVGLRRTRRRPPAKGR